MSKEPKMELAGILDGAIGGLVSALLLGLWKYVRRPIYVPNENIDTDKMLGVPPDGWSYAFIRRDQVGSKEPQGYRRFLRGAFYREHVQQTPGGELVLMIHRTGPRD